MQQLTNPKPLKALNFHGLQVNYLYTARFEIRFDKTCEERVFAYVGERKTNSLLFAIVLPTEEARGIYRELRRRGAAPVPEQATC